MFSQEVSDYLDTDAREKHTKFLVENSSTTAHFWIEILMEEVEIVLAQN